MRDTHYSKSLVSLHAIWKTLRDAAGPHSPLRVSELPDKLGKTVSRDTVRRLFPREKPLIELLFPGVVAEAGSFTVRTVYRRGDTLHIVLDPPADPAAEQEEALVRQLRRGLDLGIGSFPFLLRCINAAGGDQGRENTVSLLPYEEWDARPKLFARGGSAPGYYLTYGLSDAEWRIFADLVQVYPFISAVQEQRFLSTLDHLHKPPLVRLSRRYVFRQEDSGLFEQIAVLDEAIRSRRKVLLTSCKYTLQKNSRSRRWESVLSNKGTAGARDIEVEPYGLIWSGGNYYLVCWGGWGWMNLRADRIQDAELLDETFAPRAKLDLMEHRNRCPVMYPGEPVPVRMRCHTRVLSVLLDLFGELPEYSAPQAGGWFEVSISVAPAGVRLFAMQYAASVVVLEPKELRDEILRGLRAAREEKYPEAGPA